MTGAPWILRSLLFVPGSRADMMQKAARYGADALILDLEDGVAPEAKPYARQCVAAALEAQFAEELPVLVRVNDLTSGLLDDDLAQALRPRVNAVCLPKAGSPEEIEALDARLQTLEDGWALPRGRVRIIPMVESARGVLNAPAIARGPRVAAVGFGAEDYTADIGVARTGEGGELHFARAAVALAAHAAAVEPLDGIYADFRDLDGLRADTIAARALGYSGKMVIHPMQIETVHRAFTPSTEDVDRARRIVAAFEEARARGTGIAVVDGGMVDRPVVLRAQRILKIASRG